MVFTPFPYVIGYNLGAPDMYWRTRTPEYVKNYYDHEGFSPDELIDWGLPPDIAEREYERLWKEQ